MTTTTTQLQGKASTLAHRGMDAVHDGALQLRDQASDLTDNTVRYIQTKPFQSVLIAAAAGAALMAIFSALGRSRH